MKRGRKPSALGMALLTLLPCLGLANEPAPVVAAKSSRFLWVGAGGEVLKDTWPFRNEWRWEKVYPKDEFLRPVLRVTVEIPASVTIEKFDISAGQVTFVQTDARGGQTMLVDSLAPQTTLHLVIEDSRKIFPRDVSFSILQNEAPSSLWIHESCVDEGLLLKPQKENSLKYLYLAAYCQSDQSQVSVSFSWSEDLMLKVLEKSRFEKKGGVGRFSQTFRFPKKQAKGVKPPYSLGTLVLEKTSGKTQDKEKTTKLDVEWRPKPPFRRFQQTVSLGTSYLVYSEVPPGIRIQQLNLTGKYGATYWPIPGKWDVSGNAFLSLLPLFNHASGLADLGSPRFFGVNGRTGYQLLSPSGSGWQGVGLKASIGWYLWGMLNSDSRYGAALLGGPQLFLSMNGALRSNGHGWGAYIKLAPISDASFGASLSSRELAVGGSYELSDPYEDHPIYLTLDIAHMAMKFSTAVNQISLFSLSLGASYGF